MRAFADALDCVPMALAQNSGLSPIETLASIKSRQVKEKNTRLGVDCMQTGSSGKSLALHHRPIHTSPIRPRNLSISLDLALRITVFKVFKHVLCVAHAVSPGSGVVIGRHARHFHTAHPQRPPPPRYAPNEGPARWVVQRTPPVAVIFGSANVLHVYPRSPSLVATHLSHHKHHI
jgi:hypothetical protein